MNKIKGISSNIKAHIIADGFYYAGYSVVNTFLSLLITSKVAPGRLDIVGYAISYYMLIRALAKIPLSRLTAPLSATAKRNLVGYGYIFYGMFIFLLGYSTNIWQIFAIQTVVGLLDALTYPIKWSIFAHIVDKGREEYEWGLEDIASTSLPAIFIAVAGIVSSQFGLENVFLLFAVLLIVSGLTFFSIKQTNQL
ncbi:MAG: MFS transporter [Patescibacteria group bacterium]|jgi:MFS family permease